MGKLTATHTYVTLEVSAVTYNEVKSKLVAAGYDHVFGDEGEIDMHGLALVWTSHDGIVREAPPAKRCTQCGWIVDTESKPEFPTCVHGRPLTHACIHCQVAANDK